MSYLNKQPIKPDEPLGATVKFLVNLFLICLSMDTLYLVEYMYKILLFSGV